MIPLPMLDVLDQVAIPTPCTVPWDEMRGDDRTRFCVQCQQTVHDVSALTRAEALTLLTASDRAPCLRLYTRPDGRVMTADCATRRERAYKWLKRHSKWAAALFALVFFAGCDFQGKSNCMMGEPLPLPPTPEEVVSEAAVCVADAAAKPE